MKTLSARRRAACRRQWNRRCDHRQRLWSDLLRVAAVFGLSAATIHAGQPARGTEYLGNVQRSGYTAEPLPPPYRLIWTHTPRHAPRPAWPEPAWETQHIDHDYAFGVSTDRERVFFGSSADHAVHAVDIGTGDECWAFFTQGPVRFAPAVSAGRVYAASDDGYLYCLDARRGTLVWKYRPAVPDQRMVGNEQVIARWPSRCGPLVTSGRIYATFGIWSPEGIFVSCLDADSGKLLWQNDNSGTEAICFPHFQGLGGTSPNGYLALCGNVLVVPNGRAAPAFFDADSGRFLWCQSEGLFPGGSWTMTYGDLAFTPCETLKKPNPEVPEGAEANLYHDASLVALEAATGKEVFHLEGGLRGTIADDGTLSMFGPDTLLQVQVDEVRKAAKEETHFGSSRGHLVLASDHLRWQTPAGRIYTLFRAGDTLIAGGRGEIACYDATSGRPTWKTAVEGQARCLLVADGKLFVSTTTGAIHCFAPERVVRGDRNHAVGRSAVPADTLGKARVTTDDVGRDGRPTAGREEQAAAVLATGGITDGYALVVGDADAGFLAALVRQSKLSVYYARVGDGANDLRTALADAGLYGTRVAVHEVAPGPLPYVEYLANLIVVRCTAAGGLPTFPAAEIYRVLRPYGGVAVISFPDALRPQVQNWLDAAAIPSGECRPVAGGMRITRGALPGAGSWTHQYADAGRSCASDERRARLPLRVLWFGGTGPGEIVSRHYRTPAPLAVNGRLFVPGIDNLIAMDAYNGRILWDRKLPGVGHWPAAFRATCVAADETTVYALQGRTCLRLDAQTGKTRLVYEAPPSPDKEGVDWEFVSVTGDTVLGTLGDPQIHRSWWSTAYPENCTLFALDKDKATLRWTFQPDEAIDSNGIACDGRRVYVIDGLPRYRQLRRQSLPPDSRRLKALDLYSGEVLWQAPVEPFENSLWLRDGVVLSTINCGGQAAPHDKVASAAGGGVSAFAAEDGKPLWHLDNVGQISPVLIDGVVYLPKAYDLHTGEPIPARNPFTGESYQSQIIMGAACSKFAGCPSLITARSGSLGFFDLARGGGQYWYPNNRASCWIKMIPACGLVLVPEGSSSCPCAYNYKTSLALAPTTRQNDWCIWPQLPEAGAAARRRKAKAAKPAPAAADVTAPVRRLSINCGAPGDRVDDAGNVWLAFPRPVAVGPEGGGGMGKIRPYEPGLQMENADAVRPFVRNPDFTPVAHTDKPWLYTCGLAGPLRLEVPLVPAGSAERTYRVTLMFCELSHENPSARRTFDVLLQGKPVLRDFDILAEAKGPATAVNKEFTVKVGERLVIELRGSSGSAPLLSAVSIVAEP